MQGLVLSGANNFFSVRTGDGSVVRCSIKGKKLKDISQHGIFLILLVTNEHGCIIPTGETALHEGDKIVLIVKSASSDAIIKIFGGR